jgi:hypothetical protein
MKFARPRSFFGVSRPVSAETTRIRACPPKPQALLPGKLLGPDGAVVDVSPDTGAVGTVPALQWAVQLVRIVLASSLSFASACAAEIGDPDDPGLESLESMTYNSMTYNSMTYNALTANATANAVMAQVPLNSDSYNGNVPELQYQLSDGLTQTFMSYLVSCALAPGQSVQYDEPGWQNTWEGAMGLCPDWHYGPASKDCQEVVSSCLLARVNAFGHAERLSFRGHDEVGVALEVAPEVPSGDTRENKSPVTALTTDCAVASSSLTRSCGWDYDFVGYCGAGSTVTVGAGAPPASSCASAPIGKTYDVGYGTDSILRVCGGIIGCEFGEANYIGTADNTCGTLQPSLTFTCPASGYYTVMTANRWSHRAVDTLTAANAGYMHASERQVFSWREGAFYGNVFGSLHPAVNVYFDKNAGKVIGRDFNVDGSIYTNMWACYSNVWNYPDAYMKDRVCAGSATNCAATPVGACQYHATGTPTYVCDYNDGDPVIGDTDYQGCKGPNGTYWKNAVTTYLNDPCDVAGDHYVPNAAGASVKVCSAKKTVSKTTTTTSPTSQQ